MSDWLAGWPPDNPRGPHVAMESTGVYWKPVYNLLEEEFTVMVLNARHMRAVPGRKTGVKDAQWIADLLQHGLLQASFIPDRPQRELRELTRYRRSLIEERSREANRIQKLLEGANIKLSSVATDVLGVSGRAMLAALAAGEEDPERLAQLAKGRLREKRAELEQALRGLVGHHQRYLLTRQLAHLEFLSQEVDQLDQEVARRVDPFEETVQAVDTIPGIGRRTAEIIVAEMGTDMEQFPSAGHLSSWAGVCPGNNRSADKRKRSPTRKGNTGKATIGSRRPWWRRPSPPGGPRPTWAPSTNASAAASEPAGPPWPWPTPSQSSFTRSSRPGNTSWTWATGTLRSATAPPSPARPCAGWNASATE